MHLIIYFIIVFLAEVATDLYVPSLPIITEYFSESTSIVQKTMSLHLIGFALGQLIYGPLLDRFGQKRILTIGFSLFVLASFGCACSMDVKQLITSRFFQGVGASVAPVVALTALKQLKGNHVRLIALLNMTLSLSPILGPLLGALLLTIGGWQTSFYLLGFLSLFTLLPLIIGQRRQPLHKKRAWRKPSWPFFTLLLTNALMVATVWLFITEAPFIFKKQFRLPETHFGFYQAISVVGYLIGGMFTMRFSSKFSKKHLIYLGMAVMLISLIALHIFPFSTALSFTLVLALFECGIGILRPPLIDKALDLYPGYMGPSFLGSLEMIVSATVIYITGQFATGMLPPLILSFEVLFLLASSCYFCRDIWQFAHRIISKALVRTE
ncbi:MAG: Multidrug resistance protein MdtL [Chlamydiales bacterium]|nr:Multidrug resistance protein MdtL [Chlamydiales bacterium]MCH9620248.1 Multidrug resistance protein MdtL [Chlamydiales bacterium]MCH9622842.1 Multidrug resistance protein MdtL [Chlamydiales bacterium]